MCAVVALRWSRAPRSETSLLPLSVNGEPGGLDEGPAYEKNRFIRVASAVCRKLGCVRPGSDWDDSWDGKGCTEFVRRGGDGHPYQPGHGQHADRHDKLARRFSVHTFERRPLSNRSFQAR